MNLQIKYLAAVVMMLLSVGLAAQTLPYRDPGLPIPERIHDLIGRMTLEEKVSQMMNRSPAIDRLGIPAYNWWNEGLHGVARTGIHATVFPQAIGMAATFDKEALLLTATMVSTEARAIHNEYLRRGERDIYEGLTFWSPNINIFRDPRWGRGQETYGEDPYLTGQMGMALVRGFQGDDPRYLKITACAKHFAVHSGPESSRHVFDVKVSPYDLNDTYLPAFRNLVVDAKVASVMCAYNAYGGQPCCGNDLLMTDILYNKWKFRGYVTSDCGAIDDFYRGHKTSPDAASASADAVIHGTDIECGSSYKSLVAAVGNGLLPVSKIDTALAHLLEIRFRLGMFDPTELVKYDRISMDEVESQPHKAQALLMARESIVLLKNDHQALPLKKNLRKIAVFGPNADNTISVLGNYNGFPSTTVTVLQGIRNKLGPGVQVYYAKGTDYVATTPAVDMKAIRDSIVDADAIVFVGGISPSLEGEEMPVKTEGFSGGDRTSIALPAVQTRFMKELAATGKPVIFVMMTGSALSVQWEDAHLPAIVNAWYGGQSAGEAVADVLFGDYNPAGRLPVTFYKSVDQLPAFSDYNMEGRTYRYFKGEPLYPFGYGLSYTKFGYSHLSVPSEMPVGKTLTVSVDLRNEGGLEGDEVVELYLRHPDTHGRTPIHALAGFERVHLKAGEKKTVVFTLDPRQLSVVQESGDRVEEPGKLEIFTGGGQPLEKALAGGQVLRATVLLTGKDGVLLSK
ncbi:MAG TPA: glycoside hydrolase family 3 C-terminal domain-containing protein [Puia sp.]